MRDRIFYSICFGFIFGVLLRSFVSINLYFVLVLSLIGFALVLFSSIVSKNKLSILLGVFIFAASFGVLRLEFKEFGEHYPYDLVLGQEVLATGEIVDAPDIRENNQKLVVEEDVSGIRTKILVAADLGQDFKYGDEVRVSGKIEKPENFTTDQGKEFDYVNYLRKDGILYIMNYADVEILSRGNGNKIKSALFYVKDKFLEKINFAIKSPENLLMGGLILGEKSAFSEELRQSFVNTGTIHIVALSGYNITIVSEWFMKFFAFLPQGLGISMGILAVILFVLMTGASSTALRAGIMAILALIARATGRLSDIGRALIIAGVFMILWNPLILVHDVSFQLSFIATVALIFFTPKIEKYFSGITKSFKLREIISSTFAVYIFVLPFILYKMGNLSIVALPANILILPFIPFTMFLGFMTSALGLIWYALSVPIGYLTYFLLHYELGVVNFFAHIPFASFSIPHFPLWITILIYLYFIYRLFGRGIREFFTAPS